MSQPQPSFTARIARSFLLLALLAVSLVSVVAYVRGRRALQAAAYSRLTMTATLKEKEITRWLESCEEDFLLIAEFPTVQQNIQQLLESNPGSAAYQEAYGRLSLYFRAISQQKPKFTSLSILNRANKIVLSTEPQKEGASVINTDLTELETVVAGENFAPNIHVSPTTGKPAITYARKVFDDTDKRQGMILASLNLKRIDDIISERTGLDRTGETYLVGRLANKTAFISREKTAVPLPEGPISDGIEAAFNGQSGQALYNNYLGQPVIGVYRWMEKQDLALLAEMSKDEAFAPARNLAASISLVGLGAAGILLLGVSRLARQLSLSRQQIENYSHQLEETAAAANSANQAKSEFLANMSHELRTPLNAILGFTQLMQRAELAAEGPEGSGPEKSININNPRHEPGHSKSTAQQDYLSIISRSGEHLLNLINDVLSMSKIEAGQITFDPVGFDLHSLLLTLEEMFRFKAQAKGLQLSVTVEEAVPQFIQTDQVKLRQVLVNLLGNAIKFTAAGSVSLLVSCDPPETHTHQQVIHFAVRDTGPGISYAERAHLFDPFYQASKMRKTQQGTGLGLAISQRFVALMGGEITVDSEAEQGATFAFSIAATLSRGEDLPSPTQGQVVALEPGQIAYRILVVEDVFSSRRLLMDLLRQVGFQVRAVDNGKAAIAQYQAWQPHLIWMDMRMPVMDGYEATQQIRKLQQSPVKIIAITASAFEEERAAVLACGCDDLVRKPFQEGVIFDTLAQHLGVRYRYQRVTSSAGPAPASRSPALPPREAEPRGVPPEFASVDSGPIDLKVMPADWLAQVHRAAVEVDAEKLYQLIDQIPPEHAQLAEALSRFTRQFCFDELIALTQIHV